jgi:hypothetical protein
MRILIVLNGVMNYVKSNKMACMVLLHNPHTHPMMHADMMG